LRQELSGMDRSLLVSAAEGAIGKTQIPHQSQRLIDVLHNNFSALADLPDILVELAGDIDADVKEQIYIGATATILTLKEYAEGADMRALFPDLHIEG